MKAAGFFGKNSREKAGYVYAIRWTLAVSLALALVTLIALLCVPALAAGGAEKMANGIVIDGIDVSGYTRAEAYNAVYESVNSRLSSMTIKVRQGAGSYVITAADITVSTDINDVLNVALAYGAGSKAFELLPDSVIRTESGAEYKTTYSVDEDTLKESAKNIAAVFNTEAAEPYAEPDRNSSVPSFKFHEGVPGQKLDEDALVQAIAENIAKGELNTEITPQFSIIEPTKTSEQVKAAAVQRSVFKTYYATGSLKAKSRIFNVQKGARILNGCTIQPGEEFSFNDYIGPRTYDGGWESAPGIVNGNQYEMQAGGGICQVSTTLHNAVMLAGPELEVTLRKNHSWPSSYVDYGLDATVSTGGPDFKFQNNTDSPVYIFAYADNVHYVMTVYIYGAPLPDGITYNVYATTDEVVEPEDAKIIKEPTWPETKTQVTIQSRRGYKTTAYRDTLKDGVVIDTEVMYHYNYRAVRGEKHVGTKPVQEKAPDVSAAPTTAPVTP